MVLRKLILSECKVTFEPVNEDQDPYSHFDDPEVAKQVISDHENKTVFAWFCAKVTVSWNGFSETEYLGCCSYESEQDFLGDAYYKDMCNRALGELNDDLEATYTLLQSLVEPSQQRS